MKNNHPVKVWEEHLMIPTYEVGEPEKYPVFSDKRVYQASSGVVYPHPVVEKIANTKVDKTWDVVYIENDYIKIMILPALGGRVQMAYDKLRERHFVYYNHVIKPALVGLTGPWISGGIEFNWPQHHRPSTYDPVDYTIEEREDGSKTIWVSEIERMFHTKGMAGFTLYPDKAYLEIRVQLYNRTPHPQTFLWWANPAVAVNDAYQSVFPPDVNAVFDHGKRDVSAFPIAKGEYYKVNYAPGTDISRYKNIPVPTSYMAITSNYDFVGGYENDTKGGLLHVANHHVSPGKKQWTWGNGEFGRAWDRNLTDEDGPYIELMCGVYTDNQPDFSWLQPYEEKSFKQYFMPYYNVGMVKNATKEAMLNLEIDQEQASLKFYVTASYPQCKILLQAKDKVLFEDSADLDPATVYEKTVTIGEVNHQALTLSLTDQHGKVLVAWQMEADEMNEIPAPAKAIRQLEDIETNEDLYLSGLHLEQYRHATYDSRDYYREALRRDPGDVRSNNALGLWYLKRARFAKALSHFDRAIERLTEKNPNPYNGEPYFNRGIALQFLGRDDEAYAAFYKSCWNAAWQDAGYFHVALLDYKQNNLAQALEHIDRSLYKNWLNHRARHLKVMILSALHRRDEARKWVEESLLFDNFNLGVLYEAYQLFQDETYLDTLKRLARGEVQNYMAYALDYAQAGAYTTAIAFLDILSDAKELVYPMALYLKGWFLLKANKESEAQSVFAKAEKMPQDYCFPNCVEEVIALEAALKLRPEDARAAYYIGNFWYAYKQYDKAQETWELSSALDPHNALCQRNLALLYYNKKRQPETARQLLEQAFRNDPSSARLCMELDQLYKKENMPFDARFTFLKNNLALIQRRDDLYLEWVSLHHMEGQYEQALKLLGHRKFHPWEGGEGKVIFQYINNHIEQAKVLLAQHDPDGAIEHLEQARVYPYNLGEGKLYGTMENDILFWLGCAYHMKSDHQAARFNWEEAIKGNSKPSPAIFYNDQQPDKIFYQGLALRKLGREEEARERFNNLIAYGETHLNDGVKLDYFAISLPDLLIWEEDLDRRNNILCTFLLGLGHLGLEQHDKAEAHFKKVLEKDKYHIPALIHLQMVEKKQLSTI